MKLRTFVYEVILNLPQGVEIIQHCELVGTPDSIDAQYTTVCLLGRDRVFFREER